MNKFRVGDTIKGVRKNSISRKAVCKVMYMSVEEREFLEQYGSKGQDTRVRIVSNENNPSEVGKVYYVNSEDYEMVGE